MNYEEDITIIFIDITNSLTTNTRFLKNTKYNKGKKTK